MAQQIPIVFSEVLNLVNAPLSLSNEDIKFGKCTLESGKCITLCETAKQTVSIVDLNSVSGSVTATITRKKMSAEAAIMNPVSRIIALRAGNTLQIFDLELRKKIKAHTLSAPVLYWKWISHNSVLHWSIEGDAAPVKVFDRNAALQEGTQIINYQVSADGKWCLLCGIISSGSTPGVISGTMQLYNIEKATSQMLQGHSGTFTVIKVPGRCEPAQILSFVEKKPDGTPLKLHILEVGRDKTAPGGVFRTAPQSILFTPDAVNDFPVTVNASKAQARNHSS